MNPRITPLLENPHKGSPAQDELDPQSALRARQSPGRMLSSSEVCLNHEECLFFRNKSHPPQGTVGVAREMGYNPGFNRVHRVCSGAMTSSHCSLRGGPRGWLYIKTVLEKQAALGGCLWPERPPPPAGGWSPTPEGAHLLPCLCKTPCDHSRSHFGQR